MKPRLLDLFCGAGGASMGYHEAGFEVVGVDINAQKRYPFEFHQADALTYPLEGFDVIHASPPCQRYTRMMAVHGDAVRASHPDLVAPTRARIAGYAYVIENVEGAPLHVPLMLCGTMFAGLEVRRHRLFESNMGLRLGLSMLCNHTRYAVPVYGHTGAGANRNRERLRGRTNGIADWRRAMGIPWMTGREICESIPPAYTRFIGAQLLEALALPLVA